MGKIFLFSPILAPILVTTSLINLPISNNKEDKNQKESAQRSDLQHWPPAEVKENFVKEGQQDFEGFKDSHDKGTLNINIDDLWQFPSKAQSIEITSLEIELKLSYVNRLLSKGTPRFRSPVIWHLSSNDLKLVTSEIIIKKTLSFKFETTGKGNYWAIEMWNKNNIDIGYSTTASTKNPILGVNVLIFDYAMGSFRARMNYKYLLSNDQAKQIAQTGKIVEDFFDKTYDWQMTNAHTGQDVLDRANSELKKVLPYNLQDTVKVDLWYKSYSTLNIKNYETWTLSVKVDNVEIAGLDSSNLIFIKLKNVQIFNHEAKAMIKLLKKLNYQYDVRPFTDLYTTLDFKYASQFMNGFFEFAFGMIISKLSNEQKWTNEFTELYDWHAMKWKERFTVKALKADNTKGTLALEVFEKATNRSLGQITLNNFPKK